MPESPENERCRFIYADGRRCRMPKLPTHPELCYDHWNRLEQAEENHRASFEILDEHNRLDTAAGVNRALANVFRMAAQQRISAKHASSLAYIGHLLLCSLPQIQRESDNIQEEMTKHVRRYLSIEHPEELPEDVRKFWKDFLDSYAFLDVERNFARRFEQIQHFAGSQAPAAPKKRGRPRKGPAPVDPSANGSGDHASLEATNVA